MPKDLPKDYSEVLKLLLVHRSMPFLELAALTGIEDARVWEIVRELAGKNLVKVRNEGDVTEEIVTARAPAFELTI